MTLHGIPQVIIDKIVEKRVEVFVDKIVEKIVHVPHDVIIEKVCHANDCNWPLSAVSLRNVEAMAPRQFFVFWFCQARWEKLYALACTLLQV